VIPWSHVDRAQVPGGGEMRLMRRGAEFSIRLGHNELMNRPPQRVRAGRWPHSPAIKFEPVIGLEF